MESIENALRFKVALGKFQVTAVSLGLTGTRFTIQLPNSVTMTIDAPLRADVRVGDMLTLYTEVLCNDQPNPTHVQ